MLAMGGILLKEKINTDVLLKDFWRDNDRFADLFNTILFKGEQVLDPKSLHEMDTDVSGVIGFTGYNQTISRMRDVIKKTAYGVDFIVCGIENQDRIHYAMPLRNMIYDALGYLKEYQEISRDNKEDGIKQTKEEFLSGMRKDDRLHPIITIVIYYNEKEWDGPHSLSDMMLDLSPDLKDVFSDYKINLLEVCKSDEYTFANDDVQTVFHLSQHIYEENFDEIKSVYKNRDIKAELALVIGKITNSKYIIEEAARGKEVVNMCTALDNLKRQGVEEGLEQGLEQGTKETKENIAKLSIKKGLTIDLIADITGLTIDEIKELAEDISEC